MFPDPKLDHTFNIFLFGTWIIFWFFSYVEIVHIILECKGVEIYCKLISGWIESNPSRIFFPTQYKTKLEILLGELFLK